MARLASNKNLAEEMWRLALEYQQEAAALDFRQFGPAGLADG
jgi:hypothetical protein